MPPRLLIIAGSDSGGGAGIQGDIKTATAFGAYATTAVTAVTVQNTAGISRSFPIPPEIVAEQIRAVMTDIGADAIKTGMLASAAIVEGVAKALKPYPGIPIVVDTVISAKGGQSLLDDAGVDALQQHLFPRTSLITPNIPEAERFTGLAIPTPDDMVRAAEKLRNAGARAVLLKGGHLPGDIAVDILVDDSGVHRFSGPRLHNKSTHGTGCALATAIAAALAQGSSLIPAIERAREFVRRAIESSLPLGQGIGPINHLDVSRD